MDFWIDILVHTSFFLFFLPIFYFYFVAPLQSYSVVDDLVEIIKPELVSYALIKSLNDPQNLNKIFNMVSEMSSQNSDINDLINSLDEDNSQIFYLTNYIVYGIGGLFLLIGLIMAFLNNSSIFDIIISNLIILSFIIISEFAIVGLFFKNFKEVNGNFIKATIIQAITDRNAYVTYPQCDYSGKFLRSLLPLWLVNLIYKQ